MQRLLKIKSDFLILFSLFVFSISPNSYGQTACIGSFTISSDSICPGDSVFVQASNVFYNPLLQVDFNSSTLPVGWSVTGGTAFTSPCGQSLNNTPYYWASTTSAGTTPGITSASMDVSLGGYLSFEMIYAEQNGPIPCEGPDQYNEGVSVQFSLNGGTNWFDITYFAPNGDILPSNPGVVNPGATGVTPFTTWNVINVPIPFAAQTANTMFRWVQLNSTSSANDNWGIDNINVFVTSSGPGSSSNTVVNWSNGISNTNSFYFNPTSDSSLVAYFYDTLGILHCQSDTLNVNVFNGNFNFTVPDTLHSYCANGTVLATVSNISPEASFPVFYNWSNGDVASSSLLQSNGTTPDIINYSVVVTDQCGFTYTDSIVLTVNQTLNISSINVVNQINCLPNGSLSATISGNQGSFVNQWYNSSGQLMNPVGNNANNLVSGWYDVTVTDYVCQVTDSIFVPQDIVPITFNVSPVTANCINNLPPAFISGIQNAYQPVFSWSNSNGIPLPLNNIAGTGYLSYYNLPNNGMSPDTITYYASVSSCGTTVTQPVVLTITGTNNINFNIPDTVVVSCPGSSAPISISNISGQINPVSINWSNGSTAATTIAMTSGIPFEEIPYYVTITDACGNSRSDSTLLIVNTPYSTHTITSCGAYTWIDGNTYTSSNSTASYTYSNGSICDSIVYLDLSIVSSISQIITNNSPTLSTNYTNPNASYQWIDCVNPNNILIGETNQSFTAQTNGQYTVVVNDNSCLDTSSCVFVANVGINETEHNSIFKIYPNPSMGTFTISMEQFEGNLPIIILNSVGQIIYETATNQKSIDIQKDFAPGVYFVKVKEQQLRLIIE